MTPLLYQIIIHCPADHANAMRAALAKSGAGKIGNYDSCSFSVTGTGRFRPLKGAAPQEGTIGAINEVEEERIETVVTATHLATVLHAVRAVHPYEEPSIYVLPMVDYKTMME